MLFAGPTGTFYTSLAPLMKGGVEKQGIFHLKQPEGPSERQPRRPTRELMCAAVRSASPLKIGSLTPACQNRAHCEKLRHKGTSDTVPGGKNRLPLCLPSRPLGPAGRLPLQGEYWMVSSTFTPCRTSQEAGCTWSSIWHLY